MRTDWDKTTTRRPSRNAEIIYELVTANARDLAALRTHGCPVGVNCVGLTVGRHFRSAPIFGRLRCRSPLRICAISVISPLFNTVLGFSD
jgi:hypothetical protein